MLYVYSCVSCFDFLLPVFVSFPPLFTPVFHLLIICVFVYLSLVFSPYSLSVCLFLFPHVSPGFSVLFLCSWSSLHLVFNMHLLPVSLLCNPGLYFFFIFYFYLDYSCFVASLFCQVTSLFIPFIFGFMNCSSLFVFNPECLCCVCFLVLTFLYKP